MTTKQHSIMPILLCILAVSCGSEPPYSTPSGIGLNEPVSEELALKYDELYKAVQYVCETQNEPINCDVHATTLTIETPAGENRYQNGTIFLFDPNNQLELIHQMRVHIFAVNGVEL